GSPTCELCSRNGIVTRAGELDQVKAIPEWVCHVGDASILPFLYRAIEGAAQVLQSRDHRVEIGNYEIEVNGRPVTLVIARHTRAAKVGDRRSISQQENRHIGAGKLDPSRTEPTFHREAEAIAVEFDAECRLRHLDVRVHGEHGYCA